MEEAELKQLMRDYGLAKSIIHSVEDLAAGVQGMRLDLCDHAAFEFTKKQTVQGFFLEWKYSAPKALYWSLGRIKFVASCELQGTDTEKTMLAKICDCFGAEEAYKEFKTLVNSDGRAEETEHRTTLYRLQTHRNQPLLAAVLKEKKAYISEEDARRIFKELNTH